MKYEEMMKLSEKRDKNREKLEKIERNYKEVRELANNITGFCIGKAFRLDMLGDDIDPDMLKLAKDLMQFTGKAVKLCDDLMEVEIDTNRQVNELMYVMKKHDDEILENFKFLTDKLDEKLESKAIVQVEKKD